MSEALRGELAAFRRFCTQRSWQQQHEPISSVTCEKYLDHLRRAAVACSGTPPDQAPLAWHWAPTPCRGAPGPPQAHAAMAVLAPPLAHPPD